MLLLLALHLLYMCAKWPHAVAKICQTWLALFNSNESHTREISPAFEQMGIPCLDVYRASGCIADNPTLIKSFLNVRVCNEVFGCSNPLLSRLCPCECLYVGVGGVAVGVACLRNP